MTRSVAKTLFRVIDDARALGLQVSITPSATPALTADALGLLQSHGIQSLGLSLDGSDADRHDAIRAVPGCFDRTMEVAREAGRLGLPIQVNTLVAQETADDLPAIYELLRTFPVMRWSLFFLISVGRGSALQEVSPARAEEIMNWVLDLVPEAPFAVKTTEAPSYRRIALNRMRTLAKQLPKLRRARFIKVSRFATATESSSYRARATSIPRASYLYVAEMYAPTRW